MFKNKKELIFHSIGILFCSFAVLSLLKITSLSLVPWLKYFIFSIGPSTIYLIGLLYTKRNNTSYLLYFGCVVMYLVIANVTVDSSIHLKTRLEYLLLPGFWVLHYVLWNNYKISQRPYYYFEVAAVSLSLLLCNLIVFVESDFWILFTEILLLCAVLLLKVVGVVILKAPSKTVDS